MESDNRKLITGAQLRAARALLNMSAQELADGTSLGVATIRRAEASDGDVAMTKANAERIVQFLAACGVRFSDRNR
jgi:transcriptional regulator with XRE-family HTH domain